MIDPRQLPLRDIHVPQAVSWWPPAPGWWILALLCCALAVLAWYGYRHFKQKKFSAVSMARKELQALHNAYQQHRDPQRLIREISILLRRLSISAAPREQTAGLTGEQWLHHLDSLVQGNPFSSGPGRILLDAPYRPAIQTPELEPLLALCDDWITAVAGRQRRQHND